MARFMSAEWVGEVQKALGASDAVSGATKSAKAVVQQIITGGPDGEIKYFIKIDAGQVEVGLGEAEGAAFVLTSDYETAAKINRGESNGQAAMMAGKLKFKGDMMKVMSLQGPIQTIDSVVKGVPTEY